MRKTAFISDFDGTISKEDFFNMVVGKLLKPQDLSPWRDYLDKKITHFEALARIFAKVRISQKEMDAFTQSIEIDPFFEETLKLCKKLQIPVYICSAGMDYYIVKRIPRYLKDYKITLIANRGVYGEKTGFRLSPPCPDYQFYKANTGISKEALVSYLKSLGFFTIFAGDGRPDAKAAKEADAVFAKGVLYEICSAENIKTLKFDDFKDIIDYIKANL